MLNILLGGHTVIFGNGSQITFEQCLLGGGEFASLCQFHLRLLFEFACLVSGFESGSSFLLGDFFLGRRFFGGGVLWRFGGLVFEPHHLAFCGAQIPLHRAIVLALVMLALQSECGLIWVVASFEHHGSVLL